MKSIRFLLSGGTATAVDIITYFISLNFIFKGADVPIFGFFAITAPIASLIFSYSCGFVTSFTLSKFFVFRESEVRTRYQLIRFVIVVFITFCLNYGLMKLLLLELGDYPTFARIISAGLIAVVSYMLHNVFTFKVAKIPKVPVIKNPAVKRNTKIPKVHPSVPQENL